MKSGGPLKRGKGLNPISPRKRRRAAARREVVRQVHERDRHCVVPDKAVALWAVPPKSYPRTCMGPLDPHEIIPRSAWPDGDLVAWNVALVCRRHHDWIGDHPNEAHKLGLHGYSWERPGAA